MKLQHIGSTFLIALLASFTAAATIPSLIKTGRRKVRDSPRESVLQLSRGEQAALPYPPDMLPGGRDMNTPYGSVRVYEWGPVTGHKVLFVHGISTPCPVFTKVAQSLAEKGCRVMLFDLFGRGYSDAPDPSAYPQDIQLFTSQILLVLSSSELSWKNFTLIGYSLGGGIAASFTSYFPNMVENLVLIAPAGLLRPHRISLTSRIVHNPLFPGVVTKAIVRRRLLASQAEEEIDPGHPALSSDSLALYGDKPNMSPAKAVAWQVESHPGFLSSFTSSIQNAPVTGENARWHLFGQRLSAQRAEGKLVNKVLVLLGRDDDIIIADEIEEDAIAAFGAENVSILRLDGGHDVPIVSASGCVEAIVQLWGSSK
ncbi:alpha/beta-hydrolase [Piedraia hortae CBS 480.64]|uniref:Alpha/beta-hydrolase n=1 Tax=Piedraia hortae CBS 480.64 TaxID=1314780 RepID=A0A6A7C8W4_9PEZI|nr:alpha/beta-hydrolase [Piedraia hortae CBS 480.64]